MEIKLGRRDEIIAAALDELSCWVFFEDVRIKYYRAEPIATKMYLEATGNDEEPAKYDFLGRILRWLIKRTEENMQVELEEMERFRDSFLEAKGALTLDDPLPAIEILSKAVSHYKKRPQRAFMPDFHPHGMCCNPKRVGRVIEALKSLSSVQPDQDV